MSKIISKVRKISLGALDIFFPRTNLNKLIIKYQSYPKSRKIDAFGQEICFCHNPNYYRVLK